MGFDFNTVNINYIQISYKRPDSTICLYKAGLQSVDEKTLIAVLKTDEDINFSKLQELMLDIVCIDGLYKGKTFLKYYRRDREYIYLFLDKPSELSFRQNREFFRVSANLDCICIINENGQLNQYSAETVDISANGISVLLNHKLSIDDSITLVLNINNKKINIKAIVIRSEKDKSFYKTSFMYSKISETDRDSISQFCIQKQIQDRRNQLK